MDAFIDAVHEQAGLRVLGRVPVRRAEAGEYIAAGLLCGVAGGLVFVEDAGGPGEMSLYSAAEISAPTVRSHGVLADLHLEVNGRPISFLGAELAALLALLEKAGVEARLVEPPNVAPEPAWPTESVVGGEPEGEPPAVAPEAESKSEPKSEPYPEPEEPEVEDLPDLTADVVEPVSSVVFESAIGGSLMETTIGSSYESWSPSAEPSPADGFMESSRGSFMEASVGLSAGATPAWTYTTSVEQQEPAAVLHAGSLVETSVGTLPPSSEAVTTPSIAEPWRGSLIETPVGTIDEPGHAGMETTVGWREYAEDDQSSEIGELYRPVPSMIETELDEEELESIREQIREANRAEESEQEPAPKPPLRPREPEPAPAEIEVSLTTFDDIEHLDPEEPVAVHEGRAEFQMPLDAFVRAIEDGSFGPNVHYRLVRSRTGFVRLGDTDLYARLTPDVEDTTEVPPVVPASSGKGWRYLGLGLGAAVGWMGGGGFWAVVIGGAIGYVTGRLIAAILRAAR